MSHFDAFVPSLVRTRLAKAPSAVWHHSAEAFEAPVLFADLSGFSILAEQLAERGPSGVEDLKDLLNLFFGRLVDLVHGHGGQIVSFPGDAVLAVWPADAGDPSASIRLAVHCGLAAQDAFPQRTAGPAAELRLRVGVGFGRVWAAHVGGVDERWHLVVAGDSLAQAVEALQAARPGEVLISRAAWERVPEGASEWVTPRVARIRSAGMAAVFPSAPIEAPPAPDEVLRRYVPRSIAARIDAGQTDWLAELRRLSILFVNLGPLDSEAAGALDRLQRATVIVQSAVHRYGGNVGHLVADDKGTVIDCGWGLALHAHADDAVRAARAAIEMQRQLTAMGVDATFGLAAGGVFTGLRGNRERCDFAMIGSVVNLAAAMMQCGAGGIICDAGLCDATGGWAQFDPLPPIWLKAHERPVETYRLVEVAQAGPSTIVGRVRERRILEQHLDRLLGDGAGSVVIVEGEAGIGKSRLLADMMERAVSRSVRVVLARGDAIERSAPYHVWRRLFDTLLGPGGPGAAPEDRLIALLQPAPALAPFAPLLNPILGLNLEDNDRSRSATPQGRAALTRDLLVHLFSRAVGSQPTLLVLDDTHWFDSASWALTEGIERQLPQILVLIATRPVPQEDTPPELERIGARGTTSVLRLEALAGPEIRALVCQRLRSRRLDERVERLILTKAEGHPFFTEELAHALRDRGLVHVQDGVCRFTGPAAADESVLLPNTVRVMVSSRIDQLTVQQQLTVKVASVFGRSFDLVSLRAIYPIDIELGELAEHVRSLIEHELIRIVSEAPPHVYEFKHAITQDVAYSLVPQAQRNPLHAVVARFYESHYASDLTRFYPLLANHWGRAGVAGRALFYSERAGYEALSRFANEEAIRFFTEALAIEESSETSLPSQAAVVLPHRIVSGRDARRTQLRRCLGEAYVNRGMWPDGWAHLEGALATVGYSLPKSRTAWGCGLAVQIATQIGHWMWRPAPAALSEPVGELLIDTVRAFQRICTVSYVTDRKAPLFYCVLAALNLAEGLKASPELAGLYASAGNISGLIPIHPLARAYIERARQIGRDLADPAVDARILGRTSVYLLAIGDWTACDDVERSMQLSDQVGDPFQWEESAAIRARAAHLRGEYDLAVRLGTELRARSVLSGTAVHEIWGIDAEAWGFLYLGHHAVAQERSQVGLAMPGRGDRIAFLDLLGVSALAHLYSGDCEQARAGADRVTEALLETPRPGHFAVLAMSAAAEVYVALAESEAGSGRLSDALVHAERACRRLERYARINPPARARASLWRGCIAWLRGRPAVAHAALRRSLAEAERFALPYETARAHSTIARFLGAGDPQQSHHLAQAEHGFRSLGAAFELSRTTARSSL